MAYRISLNWNMGRQLIQVLLFALLGMSIYQLGKFLVYPDITLLQSNIATIVFTSLAATLLAGLVLRRQSRLYQQALNEVELRRRAEQELTIAHRELEGRVRERTIELINTNKLLQAEIVDRQRAEAQLRLREDHYRAFVEQAPISITSFDQDGVVQFINGYHIQTFAKDRCDPSFFLGMNIKDLPAIASGGLAPEMDLLLAGKHVERFDVWVPEFSGGHSGYINIRGVPLLKEGRVAGGILIREDITGRRSTEKELRKVNRALEAIRSCHHALLRSSEELRLLDDVCRSIVDVAGHSLAWTGYALTDEERTVQPVAWAGDHEEYVRGLRVSWAEGRKGAGPTGKAIRTGRPVIIRNIQTDPGFAYWRTGALERGFVSAVSLPLVVNEVVIGALTILSREYGTFDAEEVELLEALVNDLAYGIGIHRLQAEREKAKAERTRLEQQLNQSRKMEAIGTLAGGIAHDFNNILGAIIGYTQLALMNADLSEKPRSYLKQILQASDRASDLVRQILTFSRQGEQNLTPLEMAPVLKEALKLMRASLPSTIEIVRNINEDTGAVLAGPTQIHQVILNLCANAAHAMGEEGGCLTVGLDEVEVEPADASKYLDLNPGRHARLWVSDTGAGIEPHVKERIFEPYFTTKKLGEGTGMGLATVHGIVKSHNGAIDVASEPGRGATFNIYLPIIAREAEVESQGVEFMPGGRERVLVVDDETPLIETMSELLAKLGYRVEGRTSSLDALDLVRAHPHRFDLVITDQTMPGMTGLELAGKIKRLRPDLPVVLCSGFSSAITPEKADSSGVRDIIMKPVLIEELARKIRTVLDNICLPQIRPASRP
ncbi:MAG: response regulator [Proteobacteria bacterium]|nr:response regulator [Pseudomonadota bacterium]